MPHRTQELIKKKKTGACVAPVDLVHKPILILFCRFIHGRYAATALAFFDDVREEHPVRFQECLHLLEKIGATR